MRQQCVVKKKKKKKLSKFTKKMSTATVRAIIRRLNTTRAVMNRPGSVLSPHAVRDLQKMVSPNNHLNGKNSGKSSSR